MKASISVQFELPTQDLPAGHMPATNREPLDGVNTSFVPTYLERGRRGEKGGELGRRGKN